MALSSPGDVADDKDDANGSASSFMKRNQKPEVKGHIHMCIGNFALCRSRGNNTGYKVTILSDCQRCQCYPYRPPSEELSVGKETELLKGRTVKTESRQKGKQKA